MGIFYSKDFCANAQIPWNLIVSIGREYTADPVHDFFYNSNSPFFLRRKHVGEIVYVQVVLISKHFCWVWQKTLIDR